MDVGGVRARYEAQVRGRVPEWPAVGAVVERDGPLVRTHYGTHGTVEHQPLPARVPDLDALVLRQREAFAARSEPARWNVYGTEAPALAGALAAAGFVPGPERSLLAAEFARLTPGRPDGRRSGVHSLNSGTEDPAWWVAARELAAASGPHAKGLAEFEADGGPFYGRADAAVLLDDRGRVAAAGWAERVPGSSFVSVGGLTGPHPELLLPWQVLGQAAHVTGRSATHYVAEAAGDLRTALLTAGFGELTTVRTFRWDPPGTPAPVRPVRQLRGELDTGPVWERLEREFGFRPSTSRFPGFDAPAPSVTWSLDALDQGGDERLDALVRIAQRALREVTAAVTGLGLGLGPGDGRTLHWLDWQHIGYAFDPHRVGGPGRPEWPGSVYPDGDYYLYLDPELRFGTLGHPWEHTLCVFGAPLLAEAEAELTVLLGEPVRRRD
ncbi:DUF2716 domain-containing protein [Streptomyces sp. NPDC059496]|uniref:DUF2716 domain-containing protein n=1 Tax=Streptomyces sp. NPDC059496 TaxID=3346851 RepID=UPI0036B55747